MFHYASKCLLSVLFIVSVASSAVLPSSQALEPRQGACLSSLVRPNPVNNVGRISFQRYIDEPRTTGERADASWAPNNLIDVHMTVPTNVYTAQNINVYVTNRSTRGNAIILTNFQDTLLSTQPRAQIRITVPGQTRANGVVRPGMASPCVHLPRLDGTWYFQVEQ
ncbi:hypothetical protein COCCADRAFT_23897 [Bipolaris zeicola 26-R-13]|uniref:Uncharacterized protein n=1 Tax=Cochliobolus carbonum (strain 26-R-13) TaxID=930089 RepID=W6YAA5_COCC2|nr:uncharacterized protein COCCADRAFT_23897 [Bipolaris zeicola 26-R-13]EUC36307.1 hypothetical protein COCCADRAFT_23897 [Bipolaris zeicola 26-R-13]